MSTADWSPVAVESKIAECAQRIAKGVKVCADSHRQFLAADRDYDVAYSAAFLSYDGPQTEKKHAAVVATAAEREARDVAEAAYRYADRQAKAIEAELMAYQSISRSIGQAYNVAGRGER